jgi:putative restriction endonuclease
VANGLSLRTHIHRLFDKGYVTVDEQDRFVVGRRLKQDFGNGRSYYVLAGRPLQLPAEAARRPSSKALAWHRDAVFLG